jgi:membrane-associated phospholipid phosphatase
MRKMKAMNLKKINMSHGRSPAMAIAGMVLVSLLILCGNANSAELSASVHSQLLGIDHEGIVRPAETVDPLHFGGLNSPLICPAIYTEDLNSPPSSHRRSSFFKELQYDAGGLVRDPAFYILVAGLAAAPALLSNEDPEINEAWSNNASADHVFELGNMIGNGLVPVAASAAALTYGKLSGKQEASDFGSDLLRAETINGILTLALKGITNRQRPDGSPWSFPSGHTSVAFSSAAVIYRHYGWKIGVPAVTVATYVGLSRLQENKHYLSDVVAGAILGGYIGMKVAGRRDDRRAVILTPTFGGVYGVEASIGF